MVPSPKESEVFEAFVSLFCAFVWNPMSPAAIHQSELDIGSCRTVVLLILDILTGITLIEHFCFFIR
jgi:hypothetical protein